MASGYNINTQSTRWFPILPQFNVGRVYAQKSTAWSEEVPGPVCRGMGKYKLKSKFADWVCEANGFEKRLFFGNKGRFLEKMKMKVVKTWKNRTLFSIVVRSAVCKKLRNEPVSEQALNSSFYFIDPITTELYGGDVAQHFKQLYKNDRNVPSFSISGAKFKRHKKTWDLIDYKRVGGNCLEFKSSVFIICGGRKKTEEVKSQNHAWSEWDTAATSSCYTCGGSEYQIRRCVAQNDTADYEKGDTIHQSNCRRPLDEPLIKVSLIA